MRMIILFLTLLLGSNQLAAIEGTPPPRQEAAQELVNELEAFINEQVKADKFSGTVLLTKDGKTLYSTARGLASKRFNVPNNLETKFNLGSLNKMFTSVAIMKLVQNGTVALDNKVSDYLDETWLAPAVSQTIEIQHLLTHASGLGSYFTEEYFSASKLKFRELADFKPLVQYDTPQFAPGTGYRYSNTGMLLLGAIIESVTGQSYFEYVRKHIYSPAKMVNSDCYEMDQPIPNLAIGYNPSEENETGWINNYYLHVLKGGPAGGCFSTVQDLQNFAAALTSYHLLDEDTTSRLFMPKSHFHTENYGFGFRIEGTAENRIVGHSGGFVGISANLDIYLDAGYVVTVLSNYGGAARPMRNKIRELLGSLDE